MNCINKVRLSPGSRPAIEGGKSVRAKNNFLVFGAPLIENQEIKELLGCFERRWIGTGPLVGRFERQFASYKKTRYAIAVNSCTAALHLSLLSCGIKKGDEVITTPMTFCATVNAIIHAGGTPVLADCDRRTMNILPGEIERKVTSRTKAIVVVHFAGRSCDMDPIVKIARKRHLILIEDCAHAIESTYNGRKTGTFGNLGCFSFYVTKNVVAGEGGMIITDDEAKASRIKILALHGMSKDAWKRYSDTGYKHYQVVEAGFKYNMMDLQAALGVHQLERIDRNWKRRQEIWKFYNKEFAGLPCFLPAQSPRGSKHAFHLYTPLIDIERLGKTRDWVLDALFAENIGAGVHYIPIHLHPYYQKTFGWKKGQYPNAEWIGERTISLPLSPALSDRDIRDVCAAFKKVLGK